MHDELYLENDESMGSLGPVQEEKGDLRRRRIFRQIGSLLAVVQFLCLLVVTLFHHFASRPGVSKRSEGPAPPEIARVDQSRNRPAISNSAGAVYTSRKPNPSTPVGHSVLYVYAPPKPGPKTPVDLSTVRIYAPPKLGQKTPAGLVKELEPAPDLPSVSSPDRFALNAYRTYLPPAPAIVPSHAAVTRAPASATSADANAVITALQRYSAAWNTKHAALITALRPGLRRRAVEQELSSASSISMRIQPTSVPRIQGDRATVECIHQVDQVFTDGVERRNAGVKMTYVLVRRGSNWLIEDSR